MMKGGKVMKHIGNVEVLSVDEYQRKDGSKGYKVVGMSDDQKPTVFYRPAEEAPKAGSVYRQMLDYDNTLKAVVRYQLAK